MTLVIDACALIAYIKGEVGAEALNEILMDERNTCYAHAVNLCEVFYELLRIVGDARAQTTIRHLVAAGVAPRDDMDEQFWQQVGRLKVNPGGIALADCFCIALAQRVGGEIVTTDHAEFDHVAEQGMCEVRFVR